MTTHPDIDQIAHLEWTDYACQCPCHSGGCRNRATHTVAIHALHGCDGEGLDPFGNRVELRCVPCVMALQIEIGVGLGQVNRWGVGQCDSCGAPLAAIGDVLRSVSEL
jgi:hypothetical protein